MTEWTAPEPPAGEVPLPDGPRARLAESITDVIQALPSNFRSKTFIEGLEAGDVFSLNSMLGGTIEIQVVEALNRLRVAWDPDDEWIEYAFVRSSQSFPDVRLRTDGLQAAATTGQVALGIELKGWYLLSKEKEPSFRYTGSNQACDPHDLLVVVPWYLSNVLSGTPVVLRPYVTSALHATEMRDYYWSARRRLTDIAKGVIKDDSHYEVAPPAANVAPYPASKKKISARVKNDGGGNFGRLARGGSMKEYTEGMLGTDVIGIQAKHWVDFFKTYSDGARGADLDEKIERQLTAHLRRTGPDSEELSDLLSAWEQRRRD